VGAIIPDGNDGLREHLPRESDGRLLRYRSDYAEAVRKSAWKRVTFKIFAVAAPVHIAVNFLIDVPLMVMRYLADKKYITFCLTYGTICAKDNYPLSAKIIFYGTTVYYFVMTTVLYVPIFISIFSGRGAVFGLGLTMLIVNVAKQVFTVGMATLQAIFVNDLTIERGGAVDTILTAIESVYILPYSVLGQFTPLLWMVLFDSVYVLFYVLNILAPTM